MLDKKEANLHVEGGAGMNCGVQFKKLKRAARNYGGHFEKI